VLNIVFVLFLKLLINILSKIIKGGYVAIKIDINKGFDTINWHFLIEVLHYFSFHEAFLT